MAKSHDEPGKYWYFHLIQAVMKFPNISFSKVAHFSQVEPGVPQMKFHVKALKKLTTSLDLKLRNVKNNEKSQEYRNCGNDLFSSHGDTSKASEMYTKSIAYALPGSRELALAYGNRSAVSFKTQNYEDCLVDIERSLDNHYPDEMKAKVYARKVRCLVTLKKPQTDIDEALQDTRDSLLKMDLKASGRDLVEKTLNDKNHMAPNTPTKYKNCKVKPPAIQDDSCDIRGASGITIQYSEKYGRHIVATRDIRPGEVIAVLRNYAHVRTQDKCYRECNHCIQPITIGIPCDHCVNVTYCSTSCRDEAWKEYHEIECPIKGIMLELQFPETSILGVKVTLRALQEAGSVENLKKMVKRIDSISDPRMKGFTGNVLDCTKYASIYTLANHAGKDRDEGYFLSLMATFTIYYLATLTDIFGKKYPGNLQVFDKNPQLGFLGGLLIKNCEIAQKTVSGIGDDVQIAPFTALCNHSCDSNVTCTGTHKSIVFALQPIKAGEQIWDTYGRYHFSDYSKVERQQLINNYYHFTCDCVACVKDWPLLADLPSAFEMPGLSPSVRTQLSELQKTFSRNFDEGLKNGDIWVAKDEYVQLIELLFKYACPCKELVTYRQTLKSMHGLGFDNY